MKMLQQLDSAQSLLATLLPGPLPTLAVVAGSGLGGFTRNLHVVREIPYGDIPGFPVSTVVGHKGTLMIAEHAGHRLLVLSGRSHLYEGHEPTTAVFGVRLLARLGVRTVILSNAAGGVSKRLLPGDLMIISDQINWMFQNPLVGPNEAALGPRFPDMSKPYCPELRRLATEVGLKVGLRLQEGVYMANMGPTYETPAEVRMAQFMGADAVGMSTVIETVAAVHAGMRVLGLSLISNSHVQGPPPVTTHHEVMEVARLVEDRFAQLVGGIVEAL
jgi:purine-nucleoside phosphorylase